MLEEVPELSMAQENGALPAMLSAAGESGVSVASARFQGAMHVSATSRRHHHVCFQITDRHRFEGRIADKRLSHEPRPGTMAICPAASDYTADADGTLEAILVAVDRGRLALAAAEDLQFGGRVGRRAAYPPNRAA